VTAFHWNLVFPQQGRRGPLTLRDFDQRFGLLVVESAAVFGIGREGRASGRRGA